MVTAWDRSIFEKMQEKIYTTVLYFISAVIVVTLGVQIFWNYKNFEAGKAQLIRDVQLSVDSAFNHYNSEQLDKNFITFAIDDLSDKSAFKTLDSVGYWLDFSDAGIVFDSTKLSKLTNISIYRGAETFKIPEPRNGSLIDSLELKDPAVFPEENNAPEIEERPYKAAFNIYTDSLDLAGIERLVGDELKEKNIGGDFAIKYTDRTGEIFETGPEIFNRATLKIDSQSRYLDQGTDFKIALENPQKIIFLKVMVGIILSVILMIAVIASLLYLLRVIRNQKQIAEIKNDLISNITHEFKTPISTISAALEGIQHFNKEQDTSKTEKYIEMSNDQLSKLNTMVERILDMATLDKDELKVVKEPASLNLLITKIITKHQHLVPNYEIKYSEPADELMADLDLFHLENALDNLLDNAVKYGESPITITLSGAKERCIITISDQGDDLKKEHLDQIFDKFFRVPKGNTHDVKGFGIGLFYTKTIIEKHGGSITVTTKPTTSFTIELPYV